MDEHQKQVFARLNVHELVLMLLCAQWFARLPEDHVDAIIADVARRQKNMAVPANVDPNISPDLILQVLLDAQVMGQHFFDNARERALDLRAAIAEAEQFSVDAAEAE